MRPLNAHRRRRAERLLKGEVRVTRLSTEVDELTGRGLRTVVYEGRGKIHTYEPYESERTSAGATVTTQRYQVHVPVDSGPYEVGDLIKIVESPTMPHLVGDEFRLAGLHEKTLQTAQRLLTDERTR